MTWKTSFNLQPRIARIAEVGLGSAVLTVLLANVFFFALASRTHSRLPIPSDFNAGPVYIEPQWLGMLFVSSCIYAWEKSFLCPVVFTLLAILLLCPQGYEHSGRAFDSDWAMAILSFRALVALALFPIQFLLVNLMMRLVERFN